MTNEKKITITFVIQGRSFPIEVNINQNIQGAVKKALKAAGQQGSLNGWELRFESGQIIDMNQSFINAGITEEMKLFLSKGAGRGG
jgi:hypothetical protein